MKFQLRFAFFLPVVLLVLAGCATTAETDPLKVSAGDLLRGQDRLKEHLSTRRAVLESLQARAGELETQLTINLGKLHRAEAAQAASGQADAAAQAELKEIGVQQAKAEAKLEEIAKARAEIAKNIATTTQGKIAAVEREKEQQKALQNEIQRLESEVGIINDSIRRTLRLREEQMLREKAD